MTFPAHLDSLDNASALPARPLHLAIGMFDGVHLGHRRVIGAAVDGARAASGLAAVLTFQSHPSALFRPASPVKLILPDTTKSRILLSLGVDVVIAQPFTRDLAAIPAEEFVAWLKHRLPGLSAIYVGENFRFGAGRRGDVATLEATGRALGVRVFGATRASAGADPISSTRIRSALEEGRIEEANSLLGYLYFAEGVVTAGKRLGRTLGFPTLNVDWAPELRPRLGVYAVRVSGAKAPAPLPGVANYGLRPTVETAERPRLEAHVFGECPFDAGDEVKIEWLAFLRPEQKFADVAALRARISEDRRAAEAFFATGSPRE